MGGSEERQGAGGVERKGEGCSGSRDRRQLVQVKMKVLSDQSDAFRIAQGRVLIYAQISLLGKAHISRYFVSFTPLYTVEGVTTIAILGLIVYFRTS